MKTVTIRVRGLKVTTLLPPASLPQDLVPPEPQPAGNPVLELELEGSPIVVQATLNGKSVRIRVSGSNVFVNSAKVTTPDVMATNGVIHVINRVLIPPAR